ncbi:MAG: amylo-alpha-1,6-glucosidase, partial [Proteobacteria bacterium]|nr:amylo-alpha-1,6-glucosidase [Pseudomonadota bacterium]
MPLELSVGPPRLALNQGHCFLVTDEDGQVRWPSEKGLYNADTRLVSSWRIYANGEEWDLLSAANVAYYAARVFLANRTLATEAGVIEEGALGLVVSRTLGGGLHEDIDLTNHAGHAIRFNLEIAIRSDFADLFEVKTGRIVRRGRIATEWSPRAARQTTSYVNGDFRRALVIKVRNAGSNAVYANGRISFDIRLEAGEAWHACLLYEFHDGDKPRRPPR